MFKLHQGANFEFEYVHENFSKFKMIRENLQKDRKKLFDEEEKMKVENLVSLSLK